MSDATPAFDFSQFVPGFDFLKNLAAGAAAPGQGAGSVPGLPSLSSWVAPTISVEEVDKRIQELKTVQYWLEQNGHALKATIQALEVQKMTLSTLRGMNVRMEDLASAFTRNANAATAAAMPSAPPPPPPAAAPAPAPAALATPMTSFFNRMAEAMQPPVSEDTEAAAEPEPAAARATPAGDRADGAQAPRDALATPDAPDAAGATAGVVDPLKWWGSLTQQFQHIAESAMKDAAQIQMPVMPQMPGLSGSTPTPSKARRSAKAKGVAAKAAGTAGAARKAAGTGAGAARSKPSPSSASVRSKGAAPKAAPAPKPAAPASRRRPRG